MKIDIRLSPEQVAEALGNYVQDKKMVPDSMLKDSTRVAWSMDVSRNWGGTGTINEVIVTVTSKDDPSK